jgi:hypothetical protein
MSLRIGQGLARNELLDDAHGGPTDTEGLCGGCDGIGLQVFGPRRSGVRAEQPAFQKLMSSSGNPAGHPSGDAQPSSAAFAPHT